MPLDCRHILHMLSVFVAIGASPAFADIVEEARLFKVDDYFKISRITELALSSDGEMIAYAVRTPSLDEDRSVRAIYVSEAIPDAEPKHVEAMEKARNITWIPGTHELAFLSDRQNTTQVYSINMQTLEIRQHTKSDRPVIEFSFSPDGSALVWLAQTNPDFEPSSISLDYDMRPDYHRSGLHKELLAGGRGVLIDSENTSVYNFINPDWIDTTIRPSHTVWLERFGAPVNRVDVRGQVGSFYWATDGSKLSIVYVAAGVPNEALAYTYSSLGVYDVGKGTFTSLAQARLPSGTESAQYYLGGEWIPGKDKLLVRRVTEHDRRANVTDWTLVDLGADVSLGDEDHVWREIEAYGSDAEPAFLAASENTIFSNRTVRARPSLYEVTASGIQRAEMLQHLTGSISSVRFSVDFEVAAFINESLTRPPEIYVWREGNQIAKVTRLNEEIAKKELPRASEVTWKSKDGVTVHGWLLEPVERMAATKPWPLVTFVHGGPALPFLDEFAFYFKAYGGIWPYPFEAYAASGIAVFIPNYRGTKTFGADFADPSRLDGEPVDDIVSGVKHLIRKGVADPSRLGISGHSHGAWLGPLVMTRLKLFQAGSFAEGTQNRIVNYSLMPGFLNRIFHDVQYGASLYDDPQHYIDLSPDLHFEGLDTAVIFEAGAKSLAIAMMGSPKAAQRAGMPAEFIVYPRTGHNLHVPGLQRESAERNLDWFRFWLQGYEGPAPGKVDQYVRWREMRDKRCEGLRDDEAPWYCKSGAVDKTAMKQ